jgi:hypothetical protein
MVGEWSAAVRPGRRRDRRVRSGGRAVRGAGSARPADSAGPLRWADYPAGLRFLWATPVLRAPTMLPPVQTFVTLGVTDLLIFRLRHDLCPAISLPRGRRACAPG